jgi:hypothetical protein
MEIQQHCAGHSRYSPSNSKGPRRQHLVQRLVLPIPQRMLSCMIVWISRVTFCLLNLFLLAFAFNREQLFSLNETMLNGLKYDSSKIS